MIMKKILSFNNSDFYLNWFDKDWGQVEQFLKENGLDGIEMFFYGQDANMHFNSRIIKGIHMRYWPNWVNFWKGDFEALKDEYCTIDNIKEIFGGLRREDLLREKKKNISMTLEYNPLYYVHHVSDCDVKSILTGEFTYSNKEVLDSSIEYINQFSKAMNGEAYLLFENLMWPGLNFLDYDLTKYFIENIEYEKKGFVLDLSHLIITNRNISNIQDGAKYILEKLAGMKDLLDYIKVIHINKTVPQFYSPQKAKEVLDAYYNADMRTKYEIIGKYLKKLDWHQPFDDESLNDIIKLANPEILVYESIPNSRSQLNEYVKIQNDIIKK